MVENQVKIWRKFTDTKNITPTTYQPQIIIQKNVAIIIQNLDFFLSLTTCLTLVKKKLKIKKIKELLKVKLV
jgi:hypothetical protein